MSSILGFLQSNSTGENLIEEYTYVCNALLYNGPETIGLVRDKLCNNIKAFATMHSEVYKTINDRQIYTKLDLQNNTWLVKNMSTQTQMFNTSGSSSGIPFSYGIWNKYIPFLEDDCHYGMILNEFNIKRIRPKILILKKLAYNPVHNDFLYKQTGESNYTLHTHKSIDSTRYFVNFRGYSENSHLWFDALWKNIKDIIPFDIVITTGSIMNLLVKYLEQTNLNNTKLCNLMSQTGEYMTLSDAIFLKENHYVDAVCDHMRSWDGGATFFTCKYGTYHLLDNLAWVTEGSNHSLVSTDYFNLVAPFVNYWNGDQCNITESYARCVCGRYYRPFKMLPNRIFGQKGPSNIDKIKTKIGALRFKNKIIRLQFDNFSVNIYVQDQLLPDEMYELQTILQDYRVQIL